MKKTLIISITFLLLLILLISYDSIKNKSQNQKESTLIKSKANNQVPTTTPFPESTQYFYLNNHLAINLSKIPLEKMDKKHLKNKDSVYKIEVDTFTNLCPMDDSRYRCDFQESKLKNAQQYKLWRENRNVFALNPEKMEIKSYQLRNLVITRADQKKYFDQAELKQWQKIFEEAIVVWNE